MTSPGTEGMRLVLAVLLLVSACTRSSPPPAVLPPLSDACTADSDCTYFVGRLVDGRCCLRGCEGKPASRKYVRSVDVACYSLGTALDGCPLTKCSPFPPVKCAAGHCVAASAP